MGGMVILTKSGGFFGTEWDDQAIRPENFKEMKIGEETKRSEEDKQEETKPKTCLSLRWKKKMQKLWARSHLMMKCRM